MKTETETYFLNNNKRVRWQVGSVVLSLGLSFSGENELCSESIKCLDLVPYRSLPACSYFIRAHMISHRNLVPIYRGLHSAVIVATSRFESHLAIACFSEPAAKL